MLSISQHFEALGPCFAADTETAMAPKAFEGRDCVRLFQAYSDSHSFWFDLKTFTDRQWDELKFWLQKPELEIIFQNAAFDIRVLQGCGINLHGTVQDTMILSWLLNNGLMHAGRPISNSLKEIVRRELGVVMDKTAQKSNWMEVELTPDLISYGMLDAQFTYEAFHKLHAKVLEQGLNIAYEVEMKALLPTIQMESTGLHLDRKDIDEQVADLEKTRESAHGAFIEELDAELQSYGAEKLPRNPGEDTINLNKVTKGSIRLGTKVYAGFNPGSSVQLIKYFKEIDVTPTDPNGKPSVDKKYLAAYSHRSVIKQYLTWKRADKYVQMCKTLIEAQQEDGRIYARFNQTGTFTGRYSSSSPNLQNIPRGAMRYCFAVPEDRALVDLDYGGMELRALCSPRIADEPGMREAFNNGQDVHRYTASLMFGVPEEEITDEERRQAKAVNFGAAYGSGPGGLVNYFQSIGQTISLEEGKAFLDAWLKAYPNIAKWHNHCRELVMSGEPVRMVDGRRRWLVGDALKHTTMANNIVQGSCASAMKLALYAIHQRLPEIDSSARLVGVIHDEVLIECDPESASSVLEMAEQSMVEAGKEIFGDEILLEAEGGIGDSWGSAKG